MALPRSCALFGTVLLALCICAAGQKERRVEGIIDPQTITHESGLCYTVPLQAPCKADSSAGQASFLRLFEDGKELGPAHAVHQAIRDFGGGLYSHWAGDPSGEPQTLYFSTSDGSDPRSNGRVYRWACIWNAAGKPVGPQSGVLEGQPFRLAGVPDQPLARDRHTTLVANFDAPDSNDAQYARTESREVGLGNQPDAPGRFGGGVAVTGRQGCVMYPGLDNYHPGRGTLEFWAQSRAEQPIWNDGRTHWLVVLYPERAGTFPRHGTTPWFITLRKTADDYLELRLVNSSVAHYSAAVSLPEAPGWSLRLPVDDLDPQAWHHILLSWELGRGSGLHHDSAGVQLPSPEPRLWLTLDGEGVTAPLQLPPDRLPPNPGLLVVFGGFWGLPGDDVATADCNLDELRIRDVPVIRLTAEPPTEDLDQTRLMQEEDLSRAMLDRLIELQFHGGWAAEYHWPTYTPSGWGLVGRGVDMWFTNSAFAAQALLRGWLIWGDDRYLDAAIEAADMFCKTQFANGSWAYHYTYSRGEYGFWGNYAYIAQAMQSNQIRFLCLMYRLLGYERYGQAIRKAGDWMVSIQFPSGAWGWEAYPADHTGPYGHPALNDAVTPQAMSDLFVIWCATGDDRYRAPILKGADWIIAAQAAAPTFGWADQYDEENRFVWMRSFEPPAVSMQAISAATWGLCMAYDLSGDDKYLAPLRKVLTWMDTVPEDQRGWLWYDPATSVPVVAYYNEMLPVTHPKAIAEYIPRLDAHYGTKFPWQADRIRHELAAREHGPVYPDMRGLRPQREFGQAPTVADFAAAFRADYAKDAREQLAAWAAGKPRAGILGGAVEYGRTFSVGNAISYCERLLSDIEAARVALGDMPPERIPRYARGGANNWVYMEPGRNFYSPTPGGQ